MIGSGRREMRTSHLFGRLATMFETVRRRHRERADLARLDDRDLHDVGLTRSVVAYELNKPLWRG
jgi:uncharacterized protein YjiS (DUF1127 family)